MKLLKRIIGFVAFMLILGGSTSFTWQFFRNKQLLEVLISNSIVKGSLSVLQKMGLSVIAVFFGLVVLAVYFRVGSAVRRSEREKREAIKEEKREQEELNRQLRKEAEEAKAEAEKARKENELMKQTFMRTPVEEENEN